MCQSILTSWLSKARKKKALVYSVCRFRWSLLPWLTSYHQLTNWRPSCVEVACVSWELPLTYFTDICLCSWLSCLLAGWHSRWWTQWWGWRKDAQIFTLSSSEQTRISGLAFFQATGLSVPCSVLNDSPFFIAVEISQNLAGALCSVELKTDHKGAGNEQSVFPVSSQYLCCDALAPWLPMQFSWPSVLYHDCSTCHTLSTSLDPGLLWQCPNLSIRHCSWVLSPYRR